MATEETPSPEAACVTAVVEIFDIVVVSDRGMEANAPCARHREEDLTFDKLKGLRRLEEALGEQKGCMRTAWDHAMVSVKNELVFTELDTLMVVATDAIDRVIGTAHQGGSNSNPGCLWPKGTITSDAAGRSAVDRARCTQPVC